MTKQNDWATLLEQLSATIDARRHADPNTSYTAKLLQGEETALLKKIIEEAGEAALAAAGNDKTRLCEELADLWFHCLVVMSRYNISLTDVVTILAKRRGVSGIKEKATRDK